MHEKMPQVHSPTITPMAEVAFQCTAHVHVLCCETYNIHDSQDVLLDVPAPVVTHHHLVGYHQSLDEALPAN